MTTDFLKDAQKEIEGRTEAFYGELKACYRGSREAEHNLMEQTTQPFWESLRFSRKRLQQRELTVDMDMQENYPVTSMVVMLAEQNSSSVISRQRYPGFRWKRMHNGKVFPII